MSIFLHQNSAEDSLADSEARSKRLNSRLVQRLKANRDSSTLNIVGFQELPAAALREALSDCQVVALFGSDRFDGIQGLSQLKAEFVSFVDRGGMLIVDQYSGPRFGRRVASTVNPSGSGPRPVATRTGLNLIMDSCLVFEPESSGSDSKQPSIDPVQQLARLTKENPGTFGWFIQDDSLVRLRGRKVDCLLGGATFLVPKSGSWEQYAATLKSREEAGRDYESAIFDLTQWRRMAIDRTLDIFPPLQPQTPHVAQGTLLIVGGGGMPKGLMERMVKLAGGKRAKMVYVPCSEAERVGQRQRIVETWKRMGVQQATFIHTKDRQVANTDEEFFEPLKDATGVWFGGGRQWNFSDSYYGTRTHELMKQVLARGGVIGGSSAGASIQARFLARATPVGNMRILAPGYERGGLGFISGVAIDQHFSQRRRQKDMLQLVTTYPQLLGIGIDEATAIEVTKSEAKVVGRGRVFFYDARVNEPGGETKIGSIALPAGSVYDLANRTVIQEGDSAEEDCEQE